MSSIPQTTNHERWRRRLELLAAFALAILLCWMLFDWNMLNGPIERRVTAETGRPFHINGNLSVDLSMKPHIIANDLTLGNVAGAQDPQMASIKRLDFRLSLMDLLRGKIVLPQMTITEPNLLLEKDAAGHGNWQ